MKKRYFTGIWINPRTKSEEIAVLRRNLISIFREKHFLRHIYLDCTSNVKYKSERTIQITMTRPQKEKHIFKARSKQEATAWFSALNTCLKDSEREKNLRIQKMITGTQSIKYNSTKRSSRLLFLTKNCEAIKWIKSSKSTTCSKLKLSEVTNLSYGFSGLQDPSWQTLCIEARNRKLVFSIPSIEPWYLGLQSLVKNAKCRMLSPSQFLFRKFQLKVASLSEGNGYEWYIKNKFLPTIRLDEMKTPKYNIMANTSFGKEFYNPQQNLDYEPIQTQRTRSTFSLFSTMDTSKNLTDTSENCYLNIIKEKIDEINELKRQISSQEKESQRLNRTCETMSKKLKRREKHSDKTNVLFRGSDRKTTFLQELEDPFATKKQDVENPFPTKKTKQRAQSVRNEAGTLRKDLSQLRQQICDFNKEMKSAVPQLVDVVRQVNGRVGELEVENKKLKRESRFYNSFMV